MQLAQLEDRAKAAEHASAAALASLRLEHAHALREAERRSERDRAECDAVHSAQRAEQLQARRRRLTGRPYAAGCGACIVVVSWVPLGSGGLPQHSKCCTARRCCCTTRRCTALVLCCTALVLW